jgi:hypothetical protein
MEAAANEKEKIFLEVEKKFTDEIHSTVPAHIAQNLNFCCDDIDEESMITMGDIIKGIPEYSSLSFREIYFVLIYTYYSLRFNEQTEDWLKINFLKRNVLNGPLVLDLYYNVTGGDIMVNGTNVSSAIRRYILEIRGGKRKSMRRKYKKYKKSRKSKRKSKKSKKSRKYRKK